MTKLIATNNTNAEKRRQHRARPNFHLKVFNRTTGVGIGPLGNISSGGIMLYSHELFLPGGLIEFAMILPAKINGKSSVGFQGRCVWCRECHGNEYHESGFELVNLNKESTQILAVLMQTFS